MSNLLTTAEQNDNQTHHKVLRNPGFKKFSGKQGPIEINTLETPKIKKNGKPSRRWLAKQLEILKGQNVELIRTLKSKEENELRITEIRARLENELQHYRSGVLERPNHKQRINILSQDLYILKNLVVKLNKELQRYQDKFGSRLTDDEGGSGDTPHPVGKCRTVWADGELSLLAPLLKAYDENIKEKEEIVKDCMEKLVSAGNQCKVLIKENEQLRNSVKESCEKGDVNYVDWQIMRKENLMLKEQMQLLIRQGKLYKTKLQQLKDTFHAKVSEVILERDDSLDKLHQASTELSMLKGRFSILNDEFEKLKREENGKISHSVHAAYITECKRLFEELKERYEQDRIMLLKRLTDIDLHKTQLEQTITKLINEKEIFARKLSFSTQEINSLNGNIAKLSKDNKDLKTQLNDAINFSKELITQEETLLGELQLRTEEANLGSKLAGRVENLKRNMKNVEMDTLQQMQAIDKDLETQVKYVSKIKESFTNEIMRLRTILQQKNFQTINTRVQHPIDDDDSFSGSV